MEKTYKLSRFLKSNAESMVLVLMFMILLLLVFCFSATASKSRTAKVVLKELADTSVSAQIQQQLSNNRFESALYFPVSVSGFYNANNFTPVWTKFQNGTGKGWEAMLMLDCVLQFGLLHEDYHPHELLYGTLHDMLEKPASVSNYQKARFDILLTDAMIEFINNLHFGKLNPDYPTAKIDISNTNGFSAVTVLASALRQTDFMGTITAVQPKAKEYVYLQHYLRVAAGQDAQDCYALPEGVLKKIAVNMERLRWAAINNDIYIHINIPSFTLKFHQPDTAYLFKVVVGKPNNPTPTLQSAIGYFTTAPEWKVPDKIFVKEILPRALANIDYLENNHYTIYNDRGGWIEPSRANLAVIKQNKSKYHATQSSGCDNALGLVVFRFPNIYEVYLHDTPEQQLFKKDVRDFSHGCIRVEQAEKLAGLVLKNDNSADKIAAAHQAIVKRKTETFTLKKALPINVTYLTCEIDNGILTIYPDIYDLDNRLEWALFGIPPAIL